MVYFLFVVWTFPPVYCTWWAVGILVVFPALTCLPQLKWLKRLVERGSVNCSPILPFLRKGSKYFG